MAYVNIWIHAVWGTKKNKHVLKKEIREKVIQHILKNAKEKNIHISHLNGYDNHLHALISLNPDQSIAKIMQLVKGESSYWINKEKLTKETFEWRDEYYAKSISESHLEKFGTTSTTRKPATQKTSKLSPHFSVGLKG